MEQRTGEDIVLRNAPDAGAVNIVYGTPTGLTAERNRALNQFGRIDGIPQEDDGYGLALAAGDFDGDGDDDLAVGIPFEDTGRRIDAGKVGIVGGSPDGIADDGDFLVSQVGPVRGIAESGDRFGLALLAANLDGDGIDLDGIDDLVVGIPGESLSGRLEAGGLVVFGSSGEGVDSTAGEYYNQRRPVFGVPQAGDRWGEAVAAGDTNGDDAPELIVGVPFEDKGGVVDAGGVGFRRLAPPRPRLLRSAG